MAFTSGPAAGFFFISWFSISYSLVKYLACIAVTGYEESRQLLVELLIVSLKANLN